MELAQNEIGNTPKSYSLNMFKDFVPMCVFSESNQGKNFNPFKCHLWVMHTTHTWSCTHTHKVMHIHIPPHVCLLVD